MRVVARAPNHLGDGVMALPALRALAATGSLIIQAPGWGHDLYGDFAPVIQPGTMPQCDVAVLFPPSFRVAWQARAASRRVGVAADYRGFLLTDVVLPRVHRAQTYAALAAKVGAVAKGAPRLDAVGSALGPIGHVGLNPVSVSGETVEWQGFAALARRLEQPVVFYGGPGEAGQVARVGWGFSQKVGLSLPLFARHLAHCDVFVSNDSGAAHFARALGVRTVVIHGSTAARSTGPDGATPIEGPELSCRPCYKKHCAFELECLDIPVDRVLAAMQVDSV